MIFPIEVKKVRMQSCVIGSKKTQLPITSTITKPKKSQLHYPLQLDNFFLSVIAITITFQVVFNYKPITIQLPLL